MLCYLGSALQLSLADVNGMALRMVIFAGGQSTKWSCRVSRLLVMKCRRLKNILPRNSNTFLARLKTPCHPTFGQLPRNVLGSTLTHQIMLIRCRLRLRRVIDYFSVGAGKTNSIPTHPISTQKDTQKRDLQGHGRRRV